MGVSANVERGSEKPAYSTFKVNVLEVDCRM